MFYILVRISIYNCLGFLGVKSTKGVVVNPLDTDPGGEGEDRLGEERQDVEGVRVDDEDQHHGHVGDHLQHVPGTRATCQGGTMLWP